MLSKAVHRKINKAMCISKGHRSNMHVVDMPFTPSHCDYCNLGYLLSCV